MFAKLFKDQFDLLFFKPFKPATDTHPWHYLIFGLATAWLAGIGRYYDNPKAHLWQHLGLGSVGYCFILAAIVFVLLHPLKPRNWSYKNVLVFVSFTSLPALLYAIPVERFTSLALAQQLNVGFLAVVAAWRVILFFLFLNRAAGLKHYQIVVAALLPIVFIITILSILNLEHAVFKIMAGLKDADKTANDTAYAFLLLLTLGSYILLPFLLVGYIVAIVQARKKPS